MYPIVNITLPFLHVFNKLKFTAEIIMQSYSMLPWFSPRHIFSDRQEALASTPQVKASFIEMGNENRKFYK